MTRGALLGAARWFVLLVAFACHDAATAPLLACRLTSVIPAQGEFPPARVSSCYDVCPDDAEAFALEHAMEFARVATCAR